MFEVIKNYENKTNYIVLYILQWNTFSVFLLLAISL